MKKGIIVNLKRFKMIDYVTHNKIIIALCFVFIGGFVLGSTILSKNSFIYQNSKLFFDSFISLHKNNIFIKKLFISFIRNFIILVLYFLSGSSMLGVALTPFITMWQGILISSITSYLYSSYGLMGIAFNAIIFIPPVSIFILSCFFVAKYAIDFSFNIVRLTLPKSRSVNLFNLFKNYCSKFLLIIGITFLCSLFEIILNILFLDYFNF